jgi:hypothetical protein
VYSREQYANSSGERETPKDEFCHVCVEAGREKGKRGRENPTGYEDGKNQRRREAAASRRESNSEK